MKVERPVSDREMAAVVPDSGTIPGRVPGAAHPAVLHRLPHAGVAMAAGPRAPRARRQQACPFLQHPRSAVPANSRGLACSAVKSRASPHAAIPRKMGSRTLTPLNTCHPVYRSRRPRVVNNDTDRFSVEFRPRRGLLAAHAPGRDLGGIVVLPADRRVRHAAQQRDLPGVRQGIRDGALEQ